MVERFLSVVLAAVFLLGLPQDGKAQGMTGIKTPRVPGAGPITPANNFPAGGYGPTGYVNPMGNGMSPYGGSTGMYGEPMVATPLDPNRKLQQGDQLLLRIEEDREPATPLVVSPSGDVTVEPLPQSVHVANLTVASAATEIRRLLERDYYHSATVRLTLERTGSPVLGYVTVSGLVARVGALPLPSERKLTVSQAILQCGGFQPYADDKKVRLTRVNKVSGTTDTWTINVKAVLKDAKTDLDREVQDGDAIYVPKVLFQY